MQKLFDAEAGATATSSTFYTSRDDRADWRPVQAVISSAATVSLQGSLDGVNWVEIVSFTASGGEVVALWPFLRATIAGNDGTVTLLADID